MLNLLKDAFWNLRVLQIRVMGRISSDYVVRYLRNPSPRISARVMRAFGATIGSGSTIKGRVFLDNVVGNRNSTGDLRNLIIGNHCYIGDGVFFDLTSRIVIEDNAVISGAVSILTHEECGRSPVLSKHFPARCEQVIIGSGSWVGFGATLQTGVTVGPNTVVGAYSLLLSAAEPNAVYVGSPAKRIRTLEIAVNACGNGHVQDLQVSL